MSDEMYAVAWDMLAKGLIAGFAAGFICGQWYAGWHLFRLLRKYRVTRRGTES